MVQQKQLTQLTKAVSESVKDLKQFREYVDNTHDPQHLELVVDELSHSNSRQSRYKIARQERIPFEVRNKIIHEMNEQFNRIEDMVNKQVTLKENRLNKLVNFVNKLKSSNQLKKDSADTKMVELQSKLELQSEKRKECEKEILKYKQQMDELQQELIEYVLFDLDRCRFCFVFYRVFLFFWIDVRYEFVFKCTK